MKYLIGLDGDDTLWRSEEYYHRASARFAELMAPRTALDAATIEARLLTEEQRHLDIYGYGAKSMTLAMIACATDLAGERVHGSDIADILALGRELLCHPVEPLPGIRAALAALATRHRLVLITKGDLRHQQHKIAASGPADLFDHIEIVADKTPGDYARILQRLRVDPAHFVMVGNSLRSDIEPVVAIGASGVHMPYHVAWAHEMTHALPAQHAHVIRIEQPAAIAAAVTTLLQRRTGATVTLPPSAPSTHNV